MGSNRSFARLTSTSNSILTRSSLCHSSSIDLLRLQLISFARPRPSSYQVNYPSSLRLDIALSSSSFFCHRRLPSMTTLTFCILSAIAIFPTISPFGIDGNIVFHFSPFDIKGKGLNCLLRLNPADFVHSTVIPSLCIFACCNFTMFRNHASCEKILWTCAPLINHLCSVLYTSAPANY
jgi:hypothetical protein